MFKSSMMAGVACVAIAIDAAAGVPALSNPPPQPAARPDAQHARQAARHRKPRLDLSGRTRVGKASFYAHKFDGRKMADGTRMNPQMDGAASKTLPLGTTAKVTNVETGESAVVTIRDRGPFVKGRIVDLSPATARQVGIDRHEGVSKVAVTPLSMPHVGADAAGRGASPDIQAARSRPRPASAPR